MPSWESSVISQPRRPAQKRARRGGSFASQAEREEVGSHAAEHLPSGELAAAAVATFLPTRSNAKTLGACDATRMSQRTPRAFERKLALRSSRSRCQGVAERTLLRALMLP